MSYERNVLGRGRANPAELEQIESVVDQAQMIWAEAESDSSGDDYYVDAVAINLHGFYAGLEHIFEAIATRIDQTVPNGGSWHQELLEQMNTDLSGIRPRVLSNPTRKKLDRYRGFRHVVRNVYAFEFDPEQIDLLMRHLPDAADHAFTDLRAFADTLEEIAQGENPS